MGPFQIWIMSYRIAVSCHFPKDIQ